MKIFNKNYKFYDNLIYSISNLKKINAFIPCVKSNIVGDIQYKY